MSTIITRSTGSNPKGAPLTAGELDSNFINLNADKVESTRAINTTAGDLTGGGDLSGDRTLGLASTGISAGTVQNSATQVTPLTLDIKGRVTAVGTPVTITPDFSDVANTPTTLAGYGITDAQATITGAATTIDTEDLTASKVLVSDASGKVAASAVSTTTLGYLDATSSVQGQLDAKQATTAKNAANGYAGLDANAKLPTSLLPDLAISEYLGSAADQTARLALTGEKGDWCSQADNGKVYVITGDDPTSDASWTALTYPVTPSITLNGTSIAPGDTATITAATTNTLTIGTGLSGTSFNGSAATTIAIDSSVVTLTGTQTLTNKTLTSPVISGGTANNVAIGGNTPAAGAFTTLSSTGNTTLGDASADTLTINAGTTTFAQGTANGVLYLNGSKVATSESGLVFDGSKLTVLPTGAGGGELFKVGFSGGSNYVRIGAYSGYGEVFSESGNMVFGASGANSILSYTNGALRQSIGPDGTSIWSVAGSEQARLTSKGLLVGYTSDSGLTGTGNAIFSGNLGLGVVPSAWNSAYRAFENSGGALVGINTGEQALLHNAYINSGGNYTYKNSAAAARFSMAGGTHYWFTAPSGTAGNAITFTTAMTLDAEGYLLVGCTSANFNTGLAGVRIVPNGSIQIRSSAYSYFIREGIGTLQEFRYYASSSATSGTTVGTISITTTNTAYNTSSDYRLKENVQPIQNALSRVSLLKPSKYVWKVDQSEGEGFIAHELQEVVPQAVTGEKDGEQMQGVDYGKLTPLLAAAIQELHAEIELLKAKVN